MKFRVENQLIKVTQILARSRGSKAHPHSKMLWLATSGSSVVSDHWTSGKWTPQKTPSASNSRTSRLALWAESTRQQA